MYKKVLKEFCWCIEYSLIDFVLDFKSLECKYQKLSNNRIGAVNFAFSQALGVINFGTDKSFSIFN